MSAFWKRIKKEDHDSSPEQKSNNDSYLDEDTIRYEKSTPRMSRSEYKKKQSGKKPAKTFADHKAATKGALSRLFFRYFLPVIVIYIAFVSYNYLSGKILTKLADKGFFWLLHIIFLSFFIAIMYVALFHMFERLSKIRNYFGAFAWFGSVYFYVTFLINHTAKGPILAAAILFVTGVIQLTNLNNRIKGGFILLGAIYGNYLTNLDFPNVWLVLGVGGLFILMRNKKNKLETE